MAALVTRPKVAHVTTIDQGLSSLLLHQMVAIQQAGFEVIGVSSPGVLVPGIETAGIRHVAVKMTRRISPLRDFISLYHLYRMMRREKPAIVHTHNPKPGLLGQTAARLARVPVVVNTLHGFYFHENTPPRTRRLYILLEKIAALSSHLILSQNREDITTAIAEGICKRDKIQHLGNGIDVGRFDPTSVQAQRVTRCRSDLGIPDGVPIVGCVGRLVEEKGYLELFAAAARVLERVPNAHFLFVGRSDPEKPDSLRPETVEQFGIEQVSHFTGDRNDLPELYALMDVFVLPSHREGFPRTAMEASAMKVPCVVTDIRGCREVVENHRNGLLVPLKDIPALTDAIVELLTDTPRARQMGEQGRVIALERFDERDVFRRVIAAYTRLLHAHHISLPEALEADEATRTIGAL